MTLVNATTGEIVPTLEDLEVVIERGLSSFVEVGTALMQIRDERLYRAEHDTFEAYCKERWGFVASRARQLIGAAETVTTVTSAGGPAPTSERQARALNPVKDQPDAAAEVMRRAHDETGGEPSAEDIAAVVDEVLAEAKTKKAAKAEDAKALNELSQLAEQAGFDMDEGRRQRLARFAALCRDLGKFDLTGFVASQQPYLKQRHTDYARNALAVVTEFLDAIEEAK